MHLEALVARLPDFQGPLAPLYQKAGGTSSGGSSGGGSRSLGALAFKAFYLRAAAETLFGRVDETLSALEVRLSDRPPLS